MLKEYSNALKEYQFLKKIKDGYYVDAKDERIWKVGRIKQIKQIGQRAFVVIRFDGHPNQWNEEFELPASSKLAPFRKFSNPYTGPTLEIIRDIPALNLDFHAKNMNRLQLKSSEFINQYYRGELFILVDHLLTKRGACEVDEFPQVMDFFKLYIETGEKFLEQAQANAEEILNEGISEYNLIYVCPKMSAFYACIEFMFAFNVMIFKADKRVRFHVSNDRYAHTQEIYKTFKEMMISKKIFDHCAKIMTYKTKTGRGFPWAIKKQAFTFLQSMEQKLPFPEVSDNREALQLLDVLPYLFTRDTISKELYEQKQIELVIFLIISGTFQRKKKGLTQLKTIIERVYRSKQQTVLCEIEKRKLIDVLIDNNNFNSELFKRSVPVFEFAFKHNLLTSSHLTQILSLHKDKHELQLKIFYASVAEFGRFLDQKTVKNFFQQIIATIPLDDSMINFVRDYTFSVANEHPHFKKIYMPEGSGFGLTYLWDLLESNKLAKNQQLNNKVIECLAALLVSPYYGHQVERFIGMSLKAIQERNGIESHLKMIHEAMKICKGPKMHRVIESLEKQMPIIDTVVKAVAQDRDISQAAAENMFEFLEEVNHVARKGININHIKSFWNFQVCRSSLLKFLRKRKQNKSDQKSHQKIINKQLDPETIKAICEGIFMKADMMENYKNVNMDTFQTIDQLLICYNNAYGYIDYNYKHTLRVRKIESLFGMQVYCNIATNAVDLIVSEKAMKRLIDFYMRPSGTGIKASILSSQATTEINAKVTAWMALSNKITNLDRSMLMGYDFLLQEIEGRMKSLNILQTDLLNLLITIHPSGKTKTISLPRCTSLWKMRIVIGQQFGLGNTNFEMTLNQNNSKTNFEKEQDLSIAVIQIPKDQTIPAVIVTPSKQTHPHFAAIQQFKASFAEQTAETLYQMISIQKQEEQKLILKILDRLPFIKSLEKRIVKLDATDWDIILDSNCKLKLSYQLRIINHIKNPKWVMLFLQKSGLDHVSKILLSRSITEKENYQVLITLMGFFCELLKFFRPMNSPLPFTEHFVLEIFKLPNKTNEEFLGYLSAAVSVLKQLSAYSTFNSAVILKHNEINTILELTLLDSYIPTFPIVLVEMAAKFNAFSDLQGKILPFFKWDFLVSKSLTCKGFFDLIILLIEKDQISEINKKLIETLRLVRRENVKDKSHDKPNWLLEGFLRTIKAWKKKKTIPELLGQSEAEFLDFLVNHCLFNTANTKEYRFKSIVVRSLGYQMLKEFKETQKSVELISGIVIPMMQRGAWRKQYEWSVKPVDVGKKKFTGLKNLAATCYINSLVQQLYFIHKFREGLLEIDTHSIQDKENIAYQIQKMFAYLKYSDNLSFSASALCRTFILDGQPIDPRVQTDVDEFFHTLMDKLERNFKLVNQQKLISNIFQGQISNLIVGQQCSHTSERLEQYLSLRLEIKDKSSLEQALDDFIKGEILEGDNSYLCQRCDKKVRAMKRQCIKSLPNVLILTLKRFEFDFETMEKFKLNTFCSFPEKLNMFPYTRQGISQEEPNNPEEYYNYRLKGIVIHYGISEAGHYTSYIRTSGNNWQYFDDQKVQQFESQKQLENECFGGKQQNPYGDDEDKKKNAYLLFYERVTVDDDKLSLVPDPQIKRQVEEDNIKNQVVRLLFDENLQQLILENANTSFQLFILYFHLVVLRHKRSCSTLAEFYRKCEDYIGSNSQMAKWYLDQASEPFLHEFVIFGDKDARYLVASLLCKAVSKVVNTDFLKRCVKCVGRKNMTPFTKIFRYACMAFPEYSKCLAEINFAERVLKLINDPNYNINLPNVSEIRSVFGQPTGEFVQKREFSDGIALIQAIESLKASLTLQDIKALGYKAKTRQTQMSLAKLVVRKNKEIESFNKFFNDFLSPELMSFEAKTSQQHIYQFYIYLVKQFALVKDDKAAKRIQMLIEVYVLAVRNSLQGYKAMRMLLDGLFEISFTNPVFRDKFAAAVNENKEIKKVIKSVKQWVKETSNISYNIRSEKWGLWRKPRSKMDTTYSLLQQIEREDKLPVEQYMSYLNALVQKHNINYPEQTSPKIGNDVVVDEFTGKVKYKVKDKVGFLLQVVAEDKTVKLIPEDDAETIL